MPLPDPTFYPELPWSAEARILLALKARIEADAPMSSFLDGRGVILCELRSLLESETFEAPALALTLLADEEKNFTSSYGAELETLVQAVLLTHMPQGWSSTDDFLRSRAVARLRTIVRANGGSLTDDEGRTLTQAVTQITRVNFDMAPIKASGILVTLIQIKFASQIELATQEIYS